MTIDFKYDDGGRSLAGFKGDANDCVARSIAIASGLPYRSVYDALANGNKTQRRSTLDPRKGKRTAREGINTTRKWFKDYMSQIGFVWTPLMGIGTGCKHHLTRSELPAGRLVVSVSKHYTAVIDGVCHDTFDPSRGGKRCAYGYWEFKGNG